MPERWAPPATTVVTGAAGWLGRALVHRLAADPARTRLRLLVHHADEVEAVTAVARAAQDDGGPDAGGGRDVAGVSVVVGDVTSAATAEELLRGCGPDCDVIHTAGVIHPRRTAEFDAVNVGGTERVLDAARRAGVRRVVHVSSNSPFGTNVSPTDVFRAEEPYRPYVGYGRSKMLAELAVGDAVRRGLDATIVRPPWFYGPFQPPRQTTFFRMVRAGRFPVIGGGTQRRSMVYVDNLVDGLLAAELTPTARGRGYWVADARPYPVMEIVATVRRALADEGFEVRAGELRLPGVVGAVARAADEVVQRAGRYQQQLHVLGEMGTTIACDISATRRELGYEPRVELYEGMRRSIRWCVARGIGL